MLNRIDAERLKSDLILPWLIVGLMLAMLAAYVAVCHLIGDQLQQHLPEQHRELIRALLYAVAIISFPMTNLIRHIMVRLNQTMPGDSSPKQRYLTTVIVSMALVEMVGVFGFVMYLIGDDFNTLYIFTGLAVLGAFLYRPKADEYLSIVKARSAESHE